MTLIANPRMDNGEMTSPSGRIVVPQVYDQSASVDAATPLGWRFSNYSVQTGEEFSMDFLQERAPPRGTPSRPGMDYDHHANRVELDNYHHTGYEDAMGCRITDVRRLDLSDQSSGSKDPSSFTGGGNRADSKTTGTATATATATAGYYDQAGGGGGGGGVPHDDGLRVFDNYTDGYFDSSAYSKPIQGYHHHHHRRQGSDVAESPRSNKVKFVCSFGGTILPRPGDGKLRYVGGETRIINFMNNNLSWKELMHRTFSLCNQPHIIKYQLPGEDLDALISVASDEDLENMLEEYHGLEKADGSQRRIRIFLISLSESDNSPLDSRSLHNNSEYHYVVALNNMIEPSLPRNGSGSGSGGGGGVNNNNNNNNNNININISGTNPMGYAGDTCPNFQTDSPFLQSDFVDKIKAPARVGLFIPRPSHHLFCNNQSGLNTPIHSPPFSPKPIQKSDSRHCRKQSVEDQLAYEDHHSDKHYDLGVGYYSPSATTPNLHINNLNHDLEQPSLYVGALTYQSHMQIGATLAEQRVVPNNNNNNNNRNDLIPPVGCYFETSSTMQRAFHSETCPRQPEDPFSQMTNCSDSFAEAPIISHAYSDSMLQHQFERNAADMIRASYFEFAQQPYSEQQQFKRIMQGVDSDHSNLPFRSQWVTPGSSQVESLSLSNEQNHFGEYGYEISKCVNNDKQSKGQVATNSGSWNSNLQQSNPPDLTTQGHEDSNDLPNVPCQSLRYDVALEYYGNMPPSSSSPITWPMISSELPNTTMKHPQYTENQSHVEGNSNGSVGIISSPKPGYYDPSGIMSQDDIRNIRDCGAASSVTTSKPLVNSDETDTNRDLLSYESPMWALFRNVGTEETLMKDIGFHTGAPWNGQSKPKKSQAALDTILSQSQLVIVEDVTDCVPSDIPASVEIIPHVLHEDMERTQSPKPGDTDFAAASECEDSKFDGEVKDESISDAAIAEMEAGIYGLQIIKNADLEELRELGSGTFGTVYHGKWRGTDVAIKRIKKSCFAGRSSEQERLTKDFWREAQILSKLHHPNVVAFYGVVPDGCEGTLATVTEFMVNGSLRHVLQRQDRALDRRKRLIIAMDAAFGMEYLHSKRIVHFDLKCDNLLVNLRDSQRPICKVGDFGLSRIKHNTLVSGGVRGTLPWMAPELLNGRSNGVSEKVDVFSFGIVMWEILTGEEPYANMHCGQIIGGIVSNTLRPSIPDQCDVEWRKLMEECWSPDPSERPSFTEITDRLRAMSIALQSNKQR